MSIQQRRKKRPIRQLAFIILAIGLGIYIWQLHEKVKIINQEDLIIPVTAESQSPTPIPTTPTEDLGKINDTNLQKVISDELSGSTGTYGVSIKNLKTGEHFELNSTHLFESGSLYKLWVMAAVNEQEKAGNLQDDQVLSKDIPTLNQEFQIDPDLAEQTEGTETASVHDALYQMITISDNYTALLLTEKIGISKVANFLNENGLTESKVGTDGDDPVTTSRDTALFLEKLYNNELIDSEYSNKMLDLLKQQKLNSKIPQGLPQNVTIAHKTGEIDTFTHDAGIVYVPNGDYVIVVMSDSDNPQLAQNRISDISQGVYAYFTSGGE